MPAAFSQWTAGVVGARSRALALAAGATRRPLDGQFDLTDADGAKCYSRFYHGRWTRGW